MKRTAAAAVLLSLVPVALAKSAAPPQVLDAHELSGARADVAAMILAGRESGTLPAVAIATPRWSDGRSRMEFWVEVDGSALLGEPADGGAAPKSLRLELHAYAITRDGGITAHLSRRVIVPLSEWGDVLKGTGVKFEGRLEVEPGEHQLRVLVRETFSQRFALRRVDVVVPSHDASATIAATPLFPDVAGAWILARDSDAEASMDPPAAWPVVSSGRVLTVQLPYSGGAVMTARFLDGEQNVVEEIELKPAAEVPELPFPVPQLDSGAYVVEVTARDVAAEPARLPILVLGADWEGAPLTWPAIRRLAETTRPPSPTAAGTDLEQLSLQRAAQRVDTVAGAYREVLAQLTSGAIGEAAEALRQLELEVINSGERPSQTQGWLTAAQDRVVRKLANHDSNCLVPLILLHVETHDLYVEDGVTDPYVLNASRKRILDLARTFSQQADEDLAPSLAASALAELGVALEQARRPETARRMVERALELDQGNVSVLLYLAYLYERRGLYEEATDTLRRLLEVAPESEEARLRLALTLRRSGLAEDSAWQLRRLLASATAEWVLTIAYEELARHLLHEQRPAEAVMLLEAAVVRFGTQRLHIQLAYALDRSGQRRRGNEVRHSVSPDDGRFSPRYVYGEQPGSADPLGRRAALVRQTTARLPLLAQALAEM